MLKFRIKKNKETGEEILATPTNGKMLLTTPQFNKSTAFTIEERHEFDLLGKLPAHVETLETQVERAYFQFKCYETPLLKNCFLNSIHDSNLILFYALVKQHTAEMLPIIYTPTVGEAVQKFSREFQKARGLYIPYENRFDIDEILANRSHPEIDLIVVSDGGGVLGIGDQGAGAILIPVAKLMVYSLCAGIHPLRTLPIMLDVGTDNEDLRDDSFYLGWPHPRIRGKQYDEFIELFVQAIKRNFPDVFLHWEDFGRNTARKILDKYRNQLCTFNDDIQGTGTVTLSALLAAVHANKANLIDQRIIIFGAGTAGTGIADQICEAIEREGLSHEEAVKRFWLIDRPGLLIDNMSDLTDSQIPYARPAYEIKNEIKNWGTEKPQLIDVIKNIKPTVLIGCSTVTGAFNEDVVKTMAKLTKRPIIMPLSNPTSKSEAKPQDIINWTGGNVLCAAGSPFPPVKINNQEMLIAQSNNALAYPGIGLGLVAVNAKRVTDDMLWAACEALSRFAPITKDPNGAVLPPMDNAQEAAREIAIAVAKQAIQEGLAEEPQEGVEARIDATIWEPKYLPYQRISAKEFTQR